MERSIWVVVAPTNWEDHDSAGIQRMHTESVNCGRDSDLLLTARLRRTISGLLFGMGIAEGTAESFAAILYDGHAVNRIQEIAPGITIAVYPCDPSSGVNLAGSAFPERVGE